MTSNLWTGRTVSGILLTGLMVALSIAPTRSGAKAAQTPPLSEAAKAKFFREKVQPILSESCYACHGAKAEEASGKFSLMTRAAILKGGVSGPAVDFKATHDSLLLKAIRHEDRQMPPQGKLSQAKIDTLTRWVKMGMPIPTDSKGAAAAPVDHGPPQVNAKARKFWAFQPVKRPATPKVKNTTWVRNPIDNFVLAKLEKNGLTPAPPAAKAALLRRVTYDLIGLPPTPEQVKAFVADTSPTAYNKVVDRLLASPQYGEKWARHWLDVVRYAETNSFERDDPKPFVWRYRDYVIQSFNSDKPYDLFIKEQLAGDEMFPGDKNALIATGYYRLGLWDDEPADPLQARYDELDDIASTTGQTFIGLTVGCARCHDHKIDPFPQKDYYGLIAFFQGTTRYGLRGYPSIAERSLRPISPPTEQARFNGENEKYTADLETVNKAVKAIEQIARKDFSEVDHEEFRSEQNRIPLVKKRVPSLISEAQFVEYEKLMAERDRLKKNPPRGLEMALCITENGSAPEKTFVLMRGNPHSPGDPVQPSFPLVLAPEGAPPPKLPPVPADAKTSGRRTVLANWIASPSNPLTARVMVNRVWQHHFGRGIVRSTSNFGYLATPPTHPELLDYLASEFVRNGWKLKPLHRMMVLSSTYRMSSKAQPKALAKDPENDLMWRFDMRRLDAEEIRDSILAVNGTLLPKAGGPSIYPTIPREVLAGQSQPGYGWPTTPVDEQPRRSIYVHIKRSLALPLLASFDAADTDATCPVRFATTQPTQALSLMNSVFVNDQAKIFADLLTKKAGSDVAAQVRLALSRTLQRTPTEAEVKRGVALIADLRRDPAITADAALRYFCVVALNLNEFMYVE